MLVPIITRITIQDINRYNLLTSANVTFKLIQILIGKFKWFNHLNIKNPKIIQVGESYDLVKRYFNLKKYIFSFIVVFVINSFLNKI